MTVVLTLLAIVVVVLCVLFACAVVMGALMLGTADRRDDLD